MELVLLRQLMFLLSLPNTNDVFFYNKCIQSVPLKFLQNSPIQKAIETQSLEISKYLIQHTTDYRDIIKQVIKSKDYSFMKQLTEILIDKGVNPNINYNGVLDVN